MASSNANNKDLSHSIRDEVLLERSSNKSQFANPAKTLWKSTVWMPLAKYILHICVLGFLVHTIFSRMEGRIVKMVQVQIEAVDKKVDCLVTDLKNDFNMAIDEISVEFETGLQEIDERSEVLEVALDDFKSKDLITRDDLDKLNNELEKRKGSVDEIKEFAKEIVEKEIDKHAADGLGMVNYALASAGGMVLSHSEHCDAPMVGNWFTGWSKSQGVHKDAETMLKPSFGEPGQCVPLKGNNGFVEILLAIAIVPEAITVEHVSKSVVYGRSSAPKHCRVSGWLQGRESVKTELINFTYDLEKRNVQTFNVSDNARSVVINTVRFEFTSNHGNPTYTCIYRIRVHGHRPDF